MSAEGKKLLWISIAAVVFVLLVLATGFWLLSPKKGGAQAPAAISNSAPPKAQDPQDFLSAPPPAPSLEQPHNQDGGVIIVYGDKPTLSTSGTASGTTTSGTSSGSASGSASGAASGQSAGSVPAGPAPAADAAPASGSASTAPAGAAPTPAVSTSAARGKPAARAAPSAATAKAKVSVAVSKTTPAKPSKIEEYWIQAASFTSRGRADDLKQGLADRGIASLISVKDISGKSWYRVRIGPYSAKAEAEGWMGRLKDLPGCADAYVSKLTATKSRQ